MQRRVDVLISDDEIETRHRALPKPELKNNSPWQELYRTYVGQLETGATFEFATKYHDIRKVVPRHSLTVRGTLRIRPPELTGVPIQLNAARYTRDIYAGP